MSVAWEINSEVPGALRSLTYVWTFRGLVRFLAVRTLQKIYRRTILGWLWLIIRPLFPLALRVIIFGGLLGVTSDGIPYFLFLLAGTVAWDLFALGLMRGTRGLEMHGDIQDVYVPRLIMPLGGMAPAFVDLAINIGVLVLTATYFSVRDGRAYVLIGPPLLYAVAALLLAALFAFAIVLFTAVWSEETKDVRFAVVQLMGIWYLLTPVLYPMSAVPEAWRTWMLLNPMAAIVNAFKYGLLRVGDPHLAEFAISAMIVFALLAVAIRYFADRDAAVMDAR
jgi:lipopolysaccharide transport system permease protein